MHRVIPVVLLVIVGSACFASPHPTPGKIGVYARFTDEIGSPYALRQAMRKMKAAGIEFIFPSGKGTSGQVYWDSKIADSEQIADPTYLSKVIKYAHAEGLKVYPVFCVATEGGDRACNSLLTKNPSWACYFEGGRKGYIDIGNPDARRYEIALIRELVANHDIDGLSLDYMRWPNRVGYSDTGRAYILKKFGVDMAKLVDFGSVDLDTEGGKKAASDITKSARVHPIWPEWQAWKTRQLNSFMRELEKAVHEVKPDLPISSYCWGAHTYTGNYETCQDWKTWIREERLDWINPSGYRYTDDSFMEAARANRAAIPRNFPFYITIGVKTSHGELPTSDDVRRHMRMSREAGADGLVFFTWESLKRFLPELAADIKAWPDTP